MHKPSTHVPNPDDGYEVTDVNVKYILVAGIAMVVFTLISFAVSLVYGKVLNSDTHGNLSKYEPSELAGEHNEWTSGVRLQPNPAAELAEHNAEQHLATSTFGTVSESPEIYHIPIDKALEHVAEHGLPTWAVVE
jgi:hypothetical protein